MVASVAALVWFSLVVLVREAVTDDISSQEITTFNVLECIDDKLNLSICKDREDALLAIKNFQKINKDIAAINLKIWSPEDFIILQDLASKAEELFSNNSFRESEEAYAKAILLAKTFIQQSKISLELFIKNGYNFLLANNWIDAEKLFRKALTISPDHLLANEGLKRALVLEQVLDFLKEANLLINVNSLDQAKKLILQASKLDTKNSSTKELIIKVNELIKNRDISEALIAGYASLNNNQYSDANYFFKKVLALESQSLAALRGMKEVEQGIIIETINNERLLAEQSFESENFSKALTHYQKILNLQKNIDFAVTGLNEVRVFIDLEKKIDRYLDNPNRLSSRAVFLEASQVLELITSYNLRERLIAKKIQLSKLLNQYSKPITLVISSDNKTNISLLNVGNLGFFSSKELKLSSGTYTFIGKRKGYVNVRQIIDLTESTNIKIECNEKIL